MKLTIQKIFLGILAIAVSIAAAVIGMYMVFLANMQFLYRMLFACVFMFNPILTGFIISFMFRRGEEKEPKKPKEPKESKWGKKRKDEEDSSSAAYAHSSSDQSESYTNQSYSQPTDYNLPGSEIYTDYSDTVTAEDISSVESSK